MFCDHCGAELSRNAAACSACGRPAAAFRALPPIAALDNLRGQWVTYSRIRLYGGLLFTVQVLAWLHMVVSHLQDWESAGGAAPHSDPFGAVFGMVFFIGILGIVWGILGYVGTRALKQDTPSGRQLASVMAVIALLDVPFGTVLSILVLRAIARVNALPLAKIPQ
jgi:zinc-ribbon domain